MGYGKKMKPAKDRIKRRSIPYSLTFQPGRETPAKVPSDVQEFLDRYSNDLLSGNVERIMANFSDRFLNLRQTRAFYEQWPRNSPDSPIQRGSFHPRQP